MPRLIWVFDGRTLILLVLSCRGPYYDGEMRIFTFLPVDYALIEMVLVWLYNTKEVFPNKTMLVTKIQEILWSRKLWTEIRPAYRSLNDSQRTSDIRPVWSVFAVSMKKAWVLSTVWAHSRYSDQTGRMSQLIWLFAGRTGHFVGFVVLWLNSTHSCLSSYQWVLSQQCKDSYYNNIKS